MPVQINKLDFKGQNIYAGLDVHLKSWQVTLLNDQLTLKTFVMPPEPEVLSNYLQSNYPGASYYSAYEAGFSGLWTHSRLCNLGVNNIVVNAADIPGTQKDQFQKENKRDSRKIARSLREGSLTAIYTPSESTLNDPSLIRSRKALVRDMIRFKLRIKSFLYFYGIQLPEQFKGSNKHWSKCFMTWLEAIPMKEPSGHLALKALVDEARFQSAERFASFIGLIPMTHSSGSKEKVGEITFRSHNYLRSAFIESAWVAIRRDPALLMAYQNLVKRMKPNNAIIRIAKKLANRTYAVLKYNKPYEYNKTDNL
jgi:transposase